MLTTVEEDDSDGKTEICLNISKFGDSLKGVWVADSGATSHMCNNKSWFYELKKYSQPRTCAAGNGTTLDVIGEGSIIFVRDGETGSLRLKLTKLLLIPELTANLISIEAPPKLGVFTKFQGSRCTMSKGNKVLARLEQELYLLNLRVADKSKNTVLLMKPERSIDEWYKALGHINDKRILEMAKGPNASIKIKGDKNLSPCEKRAVGRGKHASHPRIEEGESEVGEKVHIDLSGKINKE